MRPRVIIIHPPAVHNVLRLVDVQNIHSTENQKSPNLLGDKLRAIVADHLRIHPAVRLSPALIGLPGHLGFSTDFWGRLALIQEVCPPGGT